MGTDGTGNWIGEALAARRPSRGAVFVSDVHLGAAWGDPDREASLCAMLQGLDSDLEDVVLGGDVFEFWFEWRHVEPRVGRRLLGTLEELARTRRVWMVRGNHDFALDDGIRARGIGVLEDGICLEIGGRSWLFLHGDGMAPSDRLDRLVRRILRHPLSNVLYRNLLHPDLAMRIALGTGRTSRRINPGPAPNVSEYLQQACRWMEAHGIDGVVHGHTHRPLLWEAGGRCYANNGDWCAMRSRVVVRPSGAQLEMMP